jgi:hypothetical protein
MRDDPDQEGDSRREKQLQLHAACHLEREF